MREHSKYLALGLISIFSILTLSSCGNDDDNTPTSVPGACTPVGQVMSQGLSAHAASAIPAAVRNFSDRGKVSDDQVLPITIALNLNNEAELDQRIANMYQPGNPSYHQFLATGEFKARYAPTADQVSDARAYLMEHGIQAQDVGASGYFLRASGSVASVNEAFQTEIHQYIDVNGNEYFAPAIEPTMPEGLSIRAVHGLHNVAHLSKHLVKADVAPHVGSGPNGGMDSSDIRGVYSIPSSATGSGQVLGLVEFDGYSASDISGYEREFGLPNVPLTNIYVDGASGVPGSGADEVTLDIELMIAMAPGASQIRVYEAPNSLQDVLDLYGRIANDNQAKVVSTSWGAPEEDSSDVFLESENVIFKQMAGQGQSMFAATGDQGAYDGGGSGLAVDDPASQPFVTAVGGTEIDSSGSSYIGETSWNGGSPSAGAGGGGISSIWSQPTWQNGVADASNGASGSMRNTPDVSLNADPATGYAIYLNSEWTIFGGTSASTPLWAAFTALVNQKRSSNGLSALGFLNPYLYSIGNGSRYSTDFHDIDDRSTNLYYHAVQGYDDSTGWGSINGNGLFDDLSTDPTISADLSNC